jgi:hypothetical protein
LESFVFGPVSRINDCDITQGGKTSPSPLYRPLLFTYSRNGEIKSKRYCRILATVGIIQHCACVIPYERYFLPV